MCGAESAAVARKAFLRTSGAFKRLLLGPDRPLEVKLQQKEPNWERTGPRGEEGVSPPNPEVLMRKLIVQRSVILYFLNFVLVEEVTLPRGADRD